MIATYLLKFFHSTFINNTGTNGIVSLGYVPFSLTGTNQFIGNTGSSLRVSNKLLMSVLF